MPLRFLAGRSVAGILLPVPQVLLVVLGEEGVQEGVDATVAVSQTSHHEVNVDHCLASEVARLVIVDAEKLPQPEGHKTCPIGEDDTKNHVQYLLPGAPFCLLRVEQISLGLPVCPCQLDIQVTNY